MLSTELQRDLEDRYNARILFIAPFVSENSFGEYEQFYQVDMVNREESFYLHVDEYGAVCGQEKRYS